MCLDWEGAGKGGALQQLGSGGSTRQIKKMFGQNPAFLFILCQKMFS